MNQDEFNELFDKTFADKGGLFDTENLKQESADMFAHFKKRAIEYIESCRSHPSLTKNPPIIIFDYINNPELNAIAARNRNGIYFIGINSGAIVILFDLFFRMLSNPNVMTAIGDPSLETKANPSIRNYYLDANLLVTCGDVDFNAFQMSIPNDKTRQTYAHHLAEKAIDFLVAHELTHIINGHLDYINEQFASNIYDERHITLTRENKFLAIQTLEMDADCLAVCKGLSNAIKRHLGEQSVSEDRINFYNNFDNTVFNWSLAILTVVRIMVEASTYRDVNSISRKHPHPRVRQTMIIATVDEYLKNYYPEQYVLFDKSKYGELILTIEDTYHFITGNTIDKEEYHKAVENGNEYVPRVIEHWKLIREDLANNSFVEMA